MNLSISTQTIYPHFAINIVDALHGHYRSLGNWTVQFANYYAEQVLRDIDTDGVVKMAGMVGVGHEFYF